MSRCPVCLFPLEEDNSCPSCGYKSYENYLIYPTLAAIPTGTLSNSGKKQQREQAQVESQMKVLYDRYLEPELQKLYARLQEQQQLLESQQNQIEQLEEKIYSLERNGISPAAPADNSTHVLMPVKAVSNKVIGNDQILKDSIHHIIFQNTQQSAPMKAWDVSEEQDRSILAWVKSLSSGQPNSFENTLYIAANGNIALYPNSNSLFRGYTSLKSIDFGKCVNTSGVWNMGAMFHSCRSLTDLDLSVFKTSSVTDMSEMFASCSSLTRLDLLDFDTKAVKNMRGMFQNCSSLEYIIFNNINFDTSGVMNMNYMFSGCTSLKGQNPKNRLKMAHDVACNGMLQRTQWENSRF